MRRRRQALQGAAREAREAPAAGDDRVIWLVGLLALLLAGVLVVLVMIYHAARDLETGLYVIVRELGEVEKGDRELLQSLREIERHTEATAEPHYEQARRE